MGMYRDYIGVYGDHKGYMECKVSIEDLMEYQMEGSRVLAERARSSPSKDGDISKFWVVLGQGWNESDIPCDYPTAGHSKKLMI